MNIFALHLDPSQAARWHCDAHVVKMIVETAQILSTTQHILGGHGPYRATHINHPCSIWARSTRSNYLWLTELGLELCKEYTARYGKTHATEPVLNTLASNIPSSSLWLQKATLTPFAQAMPEEFRSHDPIASYQRYYQTKRGGRLGTWKRNQPNWWTP